ncbi:KGK domain-containing protein [Synechocystis sp. PCC 7509]|uniref:KGK domain-containing protein n=1 Tax=Synechocystis sp. PCC 7509 TaxID=927677 RepID=UPI0002AC4330|nr:KGK domain-containing protein [Synechocystis sp. PCC 7509]
MNNRFVRLTFDEVISPTITGLNLSSTFKVKELLAVVKNQFPGESKKLFEEEGLELEVLKLDAKGWKKGKVRFSIEFCPDEPEIEETTQSNNVEINQTSSPLDDIRQRMSKDQQNNS